MEPFPWSKDYGIGHQVIDAQHKELFRLANATHAMLGRSAPDEIERHISQLVNYTRTHFRAEESLLKANLYEGLAEHRRAHEALSSKVKELWSRRTVVTPEDLLQTLSEWIVGHIKGMDQQLKGKV